MASQGYAIYNADTNELEVIRAGENLKRRIRCTNIDPRSMKVHGVTVEGNEIWVFTGPLTNTRPNKKFLYLFSSLTGGSNRSI
jgi:hypothetical protein